MSEVITPKWCRPKYVEKRYGVKAGKLYTMIARGEVVSVKLTTGTQKKGTRLVEVASFENHLSRLVAAQRSAPTVSPAIVETSKQSATAGATS